jgi:hypothetical protein
MSSAAWPTDPSVNLPVAIGPGHQWDPAGISDAAGGMFLVWHDSRYDSGDIYAQWLSASGTPQWTPNGQLVCDAPGAQGPAAIATDGSEGIFVAWTDLRNSGLGDIYAQRVNASGARQWAWAGVPVCTAWGHQYDVQLVSDGAGGAIVVWADGREGNDGISYDIYAQRIGPTGSPMWTSNGVALCTAAHEQIVPKLVPDGSGGAIVVWRDKRVGTAYDVYAQRVNSAGVPQWTANGVALCTAASEQVDPVLVGDLAGGAIVSWYDHRSGSSYDIYAQRIASSGAPQWAANGVPVSTALFHQQEPKIVPDELGGAIIAWGDFRNGNSHTNSDIYAQRVSPDGATLWTPNGVALCTAVEHQYMRALAADEVGGAIATWYDRRSGGSKVYAQRVDAVGTPLWTANGVAASAAPGDQSPSTIVADRTGGAVIAWMDSRSGLSLDIYAQRLLGNGQLGGDGPVATLASFVRASREPGKALLTWFAASRVVLQAQVYRTSNGEEWMLLGSISPDGSGYLEFEDRGVDDARRYGYRLGIVEGNRGETFTEIAWSEPLGARFAMAVAGVQPRRDGKLVLSLTVPTSTVARLQLFDVAGREVPEVAARRYTAGTHQVVLGADRGLRPGVYLARATCGESARTLRVNVLN